MLWKPQFETGIHNIDDQHKEIVELITCYEEISRDKARWDEIHALILHTKELLKLHFSFEDSLMRLLRDPDFDAHHARHQQDLENIEAIEREVSHGTDLSTLALLMRRCLFRHIVLEDRALAQHALSLFEPSAPRKRNGRRWKSDFGAKTGSPRDAIGPGR